MKQSKAHRGKWTICLEPDWYQCERGNTWLTEEDNHIAWLRLREGCYLEVSIFRDDYPGLNVSVVRMTEKKLAARIRTKFGGWFARKLNVDGVELDETNRVLERKR